MTEQTGSPLRIDIVSDVVCPWCIVGYRQLERALERTGIEADIHWHPFELNPDMPADGENQDEHIRRKYNSTAEESAANRKRLQVLGTELGIEFRFGDGKRVVPTFAAHRLLAWAAESGRDTDLKLALFDAYFSEDRDVNDREVLLDVAAGCGLDREAAARALDDEARAVAVREAERYWQSQGIRGVPAMVFDRRYLVSGAQGEERYASILNEVLQQSAEPLPEA